MASSLLVSMTMKISVIEGLQSDFLEKAPVILAFHDTKQNIIWANRAYRQAARLSNERLDEQKCYAAWGLKKRCRNCPVTKALKTGEPAEAELTPENQDHWPETQGAWLARAVPIMDASGVILGALEAAFEITERKKAELEKLEESEERYRGIFEQAGDGILLIGHLGYIKDCNPAACSILGYESEELLGKSIAELGLYLEDLCAEAQQCKDDAHEKHIRTERELRCKDESKRITEESLVALHTGDLLIIFRDITERKRAELKLARERSLLEAIVDNIPVMITRYDPNSGMLYLNKEFKRVIGWKTEEIQYVDLLKKVYPEPEYRQKAWEYMKAAKIDWKEFYVHSKSGEIIDSEWSNILLDDGTHIGIGIDVRERKRSEDLLRQYNLQLEQQVKEKTAELRESEAKYRNLTENTLDIPYSMDAYYTIQYFGPQAERLGLDPLKTSGRCFLDLIIPADRELVSADFKRAESMDGTCQSEFRIQVPGGDTYWLEMRSLIQRDLSGEVVGYTGVLRDITTRKKTERLSLMQKKKLEKLATKLATVREQEQRRIAEGLHDDVAQLLTACSIKLFAARGCEDHSVTKGMLDEVSRLVQHVNEKVRLLSFELGTATLYRLGLKEAISELCEGMKKRYGIDFKLSCDGDCKNLDEPIAVALFRSVRELLFNVVKHTDVMDASIFMECNKEMIKVAVKESGIGFKRAQNNNYKYFNEHGLGLFGIQERLKDLGGKMHIESESNVSTSVTLLVPMRKMKQS